MLISSIISYSNILFINAKKNDSLDISKIIEISIHLAQKIQKISGLSGHEKKSLLLLTLKKGFDISEYIETTQKLSNNYICKKEIENQILNTISIVIDSIISSYKGELDFAKPSKWKNGIPNCLSSVDTVSQNDQLILKHATEFSESLSKKNFNGTYSYLDPC
jgi:hypothetical protein